MLKNAIKVASFVLAVLIIVSAGVYIYHKDVWEYDFIDGPERGTVVLYGYYGDKKDLVIPDKLRGKKVVSIGEGAFEDSKITSVELGKYVTTVDKNAFRECLSLKSVKLPEGVKSLGESAFLNCAELETVNIPSSLTKINDAVFIGTKIKTLDFSKNDNFVLKDGVIYNKEMTKIFHALPLADLSSYVCPKTVTEISPYAFSKHEELKSFEISDKVKRLNIAVFLGCKNLTELTLPDSISYIGGMCVSESGIKKITVPASVNKIDKTAFYGLEEQLTIVTPKGSEAERFAKENNFKVVNAETA